MKKIKKILLTYGPATFMLILFGTLLSNCAVSDEVKGKSGAQLWGENCIRCHNTPSPETFGDVDWDVAVMHMRIRANLTDEEANRIAKFLKTAN